MRSVERIAASNKRVTQGAIYVLNEDGKSIQDNQGNRFAPSIDNSRYWKYVEYQEINQLNQSEVIKMLTIETVTTVNGRPAQDCDVEYYVSKINAEQGKLDKLAEIVFKSKAIAKLHVRHTENIAKLIKLMDKYYG